LLASSGRMRCSASPSKLRNKQYQASLTRAAPLFRCGRPAMNKLIDITGRRFGRWTVLALHPERYRRCDGGTNILWLCRCDCGTERVVVGGSLRRGASTSCGCLQQEALAKQATNLIGKRFGRWVVVALHPERCRRGTLWLCRCDCGTERLVRGYALRGGRSTSCGCRAREVTTARLTTHGLSRSRAYRAWANMLARCRDVNNPNYGGRKPPVTVCEHYCDFVNWHADRGDPPPGLSQDRINNDGNYEPGNCRWAPASVQAANRRPRRRRFIW